MPLERVLNELSVENAYRHIEQITTQIPSRLAGSANSRRMAEYAYDAFRRAGLEARMHEFLGLVSFPKAGLVRVLTPEAREIEGNTLGHSAVTDGVEGDLVYVGSGAESQYEGKDVRGKVTLSELSYSPARHEKAYVAWQRGSVAQVMMNWGDEHNPAVPFGSMKSAWGNPTPETFEGEMPDIPCVGIARTEGLRLKQLCAGGRVRVSVRAAAENGWKPLTMTSAEFGTADGRQFLLLGGHMDSWPGPQATDNAAGDACMMELSRVFRAHEDELRRGLVTALWMGHETGTMALANLGWWHHSIHNTIDKIDRDLLARHLRVYACWLWGLLTEPVLPYEYLPIATRFTQRLEELATLDIPDIDMAGAAEQAREFQELAGSFDEQARRLRGRLAGGGTEARAADVFNQAMIQLSRILVPVASTVVGVYGQDRYGHAWQTQMIPSLAPYPKLAQYPRDSQDFQVWWVAMVRARNRAVDALVQAGGVARGALDALGR